jgi:hypothetical protein
MSVRELFRRRRRLKQHRFEQMAKLAAIRTDNLRISSVLDGVDPTRFEFLAHPNATDSSRGHSVRKPD